MRLLLLTLLVPVCAMAQVRPVTLGWSDASERVCLYGRSCSVKDWSVSANSPTNAGVALGNGVFDFTPAGTVYVWLGAWQSPSFLGSAKNGVSISFWIKYNSTSAVRFGTQRTSTSSAMSFRLNITSAGANAGGTMSLVLRDEANQLTTAGANSDSGWNNGAWHHIAVNGQPPSNIVFFVDGKPQATKIGRAHV